MFQSEQEVVFSESDSLSSSDSNSNSQVAAAAAEEASSPMDGTKQLHTLSVSPPSAAESLFLGPATPHASVMGASSTVFEKLKRSPPTGQQQQQQVQFVDRIIRKSGSFHSAHTRATSNSIVSIDDFASCVENHSDMDSIDSAENETNESNYVSPIAAARSSRFSMETIDDDNDNTSNNDNDNINNDDSDNDNYNYNDTMNNDDYTTTPSTEDNKPQNKMTKKQNKKQNKKNKNKGINTNKEVIDPAVAVVEEKPSTPDVVVTTTAPEAAPAPAPSTEEPVAATEEQTTPMQVDAAEVVYGKYKEIFEWGKSVPVVGFLVGIPETVAEKALSAIGTNLPAVDGKIESELTKFDKGVLNPAIDAIVKVVIGVAGKSEETIRPVVNFLIKPFGKMIKSPWSEQNPKVHTENPEVTK